jgi:hypothetical protein
MGLASSQPESCLYSSGAHGGSFLKKAADVDRAWLVKTVVLCASPIEQPMFSLFEHDYLAFETVRGSEKRFYSLEKVKAPRPEDTVLLHNGPTFDSVYLRHGARERNVPKILQAQAFRPSTPLVDLLRYVKFHMLRPYQLLHDDCGAFAQELYDLTCLSCGEKVYYSEKVPASGIAVCQVRSPLHESARDAASGDDDDLSDRCERFSIGTACADDDDPGFASAGAMCGELPQAGYPAQPPQTLEEWIQSDCSSRTMAPGSADGFDLDIPSSVSSCDAAERLSDTDWNLVSYRCSHEPTA